MRIPLTTKERFDVLKRDGFRCQYCGGRAPAVPLVVDHVVPVARGGTNAAANLVTACFACNAGKHCSMVPLFELQQRTLEAVKQLDLELTASGDWLRNRVFETVETYMLVMGGSDLAETELILVAQAPSTRTYWNWHRYIWAMMADHLVHFSHGTKHMRFERGWVEFTDPAIAAEVSAALSAGQSVPGGAN